MAVNPYSKEKWYYLSAYAIAVKHGYKGTEEEWIREVYGGRDAAQEIAEEVEAAKASAEQAQEAAENAQAAAEGSATAAAASAASAQDYAEHIADPVGGIVSTWIEDNLSQETGYVIDKSLSVENAAADAAKVGEIATNVTKDAPEDMICSKYRASVRIISGSSSVVQNVANNDSYAVFIVPLKTGDTFTYRWDSRKTTTYWRLLSAYPVAGQPCADYAVGGGKDFASITDSVTGDNNIMVRKITEEGVEYVQFETKLPSSEYSYQESLAYLQVYRGAVKIPLEKEKDRYADVTEESLDANLRKSVVNPLLPSGVYHTNNREYVTNERGGVGINLANLQTADIYSMFDSILEGSGLRYETEILPDSVTNEDGSASDSLFIRVYHLYCGAGLPDAEQWTGGIKDTVLITSAIHGDEKLSVWGVYNLLKEYIEGGNPAANALFGCYNVDIVPVVNPYGFNNLTRRNARGVDLNRNFTTGWESYVPTETYYNKGTEPLSELESQKMSALFTAHAEKYVAMLDVHCRARNDSKGAEYVLYQIYSKSSTLRKRATQKISAVNRIWKENFGYDVYAQHNTALGGHEIASGIGNLPQMVNDFYAAAGTDIIAEIEVPYALYYGDSLRRTFGYPMPVIAIDGVANSVMAVVETLDREG